MKCFLCPNQINLKENTHERFDAWRKKLGHYTTVTICKQCATKPIDELELLIENKIDKQDAGDI